MTNKIFTPIQIFIVSFIIKIKSIFIIFNVNMGSQQSIQKCNFEDVQYGIQHPGKIIIINTMPPINQDCLIKGTTKIVDEETLINKLVSQNIGCRIIIYGLNSNDESIYKKYNQLLQMGFTHIAIYIGGMFEWLCLQDIYGEDTFPTSKKELDILKFKPASFFKQNYYITDST